MFSRQQEEEKNMSIKLQISVAVLVLIMLCAIIGMIVRKRISLRYALSWLLLCAVVLLFDCFPGTMSWLAEATGVLLPSNMVFIVAIFLLAMKVYFLTVTVSRLNEEKKKITQELAVIKNKLDSKGA